jgi:phosphatidylglycerophosphatase A
MMLAEFTATVAGVGKLKPAPGTWGSAAALLIGWIIIYFFAIAGLSVGIIIATIIGTWAAGAFEQSSGAHDASEVVIDEVAGQWIALLPVAYFGLSWIGWLTAFALFRLFDIWKPGPIGLLDKHCTGGFGTMIDDIAAGTIAAFIIALPFWLEIL